MAYEALQSSDASYLEEIKMLSSVLDDPAAYIEQRTDYAHQQVLRRLNEKNLY